MDTTTLEMVLADMNHAIVELREEAKRVPAGPKARALRALIREGAREIQEASLLLEEALSTICHND